MKTPAPTGELQATESAATAPATAGAHQHIADALEKLNSRLGNHPDIEEIIAKLRSL